ncbi:hypothetical protein K1T71_006519 [Dendrolimus kikuchii]|uniref:Uncharacterized protein n=1 Tax=Dendrolimus kikuchii TaxID=765133 RepID=A0ACC1D122_9NEOP|nr:hypothetical protein K1T71_006519 [Dendrolimus kikuchii]
MLARCKRKVKSAEVKKYERIKIAGTVNSCIQGFYLKPTIKQLYGCLLLLFVPSIICKSDRQKDLTYDKIFNNTQYAQIKYGPRPFNEVNKSQNIQITQSDDITKGNEVDEEIDDIINNGKLLVGFARDPYRYSIPEKDYMKGVRYIEPPLYPNKGDIRGKRGVVHLYNMLTCATGCDPLSYKGYGCYCGFLGAGRPTDGIDRCCKMHDQCYENIYCPFYTVYFQPYYWKCYHGEPLCALENWQTEHQFVNGCAGRLCECDRLFAMCVRRYSCPRHRALCRSSPIRLLQNLLMFR